MKLFQVPVGAFFSIEGDDHLYKKLFNQPDGATYVACNSYGLPAGSEIDVTSEDLLNQDCSYAAPLIKI